MSESVEIDASKSVEEGVEKMPSEVLLALILEHVKTYDSHYLEFDALMQVWTKVKQMETVVQSIDYKQLYFDLVDSLLEEDVHPAPEPKEVQIDQHTFVSESDAEAEIEALKAEPEKRRKSAAKSAAGKSSFARRKQAALEAVKSARASGCTLQGIADQSGLSLTMVMDLINGVSRPVTDWTKLEKGLKKLGHPPRVIPKEETDERKEE
ncbi:MAG: hypothetical protein IKE76_13235 [Clostridia bacterium]|nr:hypothetical protein [Clostridia bacterium]